MLDKKLANLDIREYAKNKNVNIYQVAEYLKISDSTMTRKLRSELDQKEKAEIKKIINKLAKGN